MNSQLELVEVVEVNEVPGHFWFGDLPVGLPMHISGACGIGFAEYPTPTTPALLDRFRPLKSVSKPKTKWPICQLYPASTPPITPLGAVELVPTAATFCNGTATIFPFIDSLIAKVPDGVSVYFELPSAPPTVPPA